jgi:hypothetical protein
MRLWSMLGILALSASGCRPAAAPPPSPWTAAEVEAIKLRVMAALAEEGADVTGAALAMERELGALMARAVAADEAGQLRTEEERESAGLALVYGAMFVLHDAHLVDGGKIAAARLYAAERYDASGGSLTDAAAVRAEGTARRRKVGQMMLRAQRLRPQDRRIASWIAAASAHEHAQPDGDLADPDKGGLLAAVEAEPLFNLFTSLILLRHEPPDSPRGRALFARTEAFLHAKMCQDVAPGTKEARFCRDTPLAPWNEEAATVILSDLYARHGEEALRRGDVPAAMPALGMAKGILGVLDDDAHHERTSRWKYAPLVEARRSRLAALAPGQPVPDASFWRSDAYERIYACATCHTPD